MGRYLNSNIPFETFKQIAGTRFFVDKTLLLWDLINAAEMDGQRFLCITGVSGNFMQTVLCK